MSMNRTAKAISNEYKDLAIEAANEHYRIKQYRPGDGLKELAEQVQWNTKMHILWGDIDALLKQGYAGIIPNFVHGYDLSEPYYDTYDDDMEWDDYE